MRYSQYHGKQFFVRDFLSQTFTSHKSASEEGSHFFNSSPPPFPPVSQILRHWPENDCVESPLHIASGRAQNYRNSHMRSSIKKVVLRNFSKFTGKHLCQSLFLNKVAGLRPKACNFIKKETPAQVFFVNFEKFLRTPFLQNTSGRLLLKLDLLLFERKSLTTKLSSLHQVSLNYY